MATAGKSTNPLDKPPLEGRLSLAVVSPNVVLSVSNEGVRSAQEIPGGIAAPGWVFA
jgi:hypothetical protein